MDSQSAIFNFPMVKTDLIYTGFIKKDFGNSGELLFHINSEVEIDNIKTPGWIFIDIDSELVPFKIAEIKRKGEDNFVAKLLDTPVEKNNKYTGLQFYIESSGYEKPDNKSKSVNRSIIGFEVIDHMYGNIGLVDEIILKTGQDLLQVAFKDKKIYIPVNENIIIKIDYKQKLVKIVAPEGLIDLYLNS
jgi:16S rRNA processing protein RimM